MKAFKSFLTPVLIFAVSIAMIIAGIKSGELTEIKQKGIIICLECIGLG